MTNKIMKSEKGQVLVFAIITMTVALALGIGLSLETISSISNVTDSDTSQKALAAAEGAAERVLTLPSSQLEALLDGISSTECEAAPINGIFENNECYVEFPQTIQGQTITPRAKIVVSDMDVDDPGFSVPMDKDEIVQLSLENGADTPTEVQICWKPTVDTVPAAMYLMALNTEGENVKKLIMCNPSIAECGDLITEWQVTNPGIEIGSLQDLANKETCFDFDFAGLETGTPGDGNFDIDKLRVQSLAGPSEFTISPANGVIPSQGYTILAIGEVAQDPTLQRQVRVSRTFAYVPKIFDFSFYSKNNID